MVDSQLKLETEFFRTEEPLAKCGLHKKGLIIRFSLEVDCYHSSI